MAALGGIAHLRAVADALDWFIIIRQEDGIVKLIERRTLRVRKVWREERRCSEALVAYEHLELRRASIVCILQQLIEKLRRAVIP